MEIPAELTEAVNNAVQGLLLVPGLVGICIGLREIDGELSFDELSVQLHIKDLSEVPDGLIPEEIGGVPVELIEGAIEPCAPDTDRYDTLAGGIEITYPFEGHGTMGALVQDLDQPERLLGLSCYHVAGATGSAFPHNIWQPDNPPLIAGGSISKADNVGTVERTDFPQSIAPFYHPTTFLPFTGGFTDSAVFNLDEALNQGRGTSPAILGDNGLVPPLATRIGAVAMPTPGQEVTKRGYVTRVREGFVIGPFVLVEWTPGGSQTFLLHQFKVRSSTTNPDGKFCEKGDSGSVVLIKGTTTAVGLLWGQQFGGATGIFSPLPFVEAKLRVKVAWAP